jgi:hypothetical protein
MDKKPEDFSLIRKELPIQIDSNKLWDFMKDKIK